MVRRALLTRALALAALAAWPAAARAGGPVLARLLSAPGVRDLAVSPDGATLYLVTGPKGEGRLLTLAVANGAAVRPPLVLGGDPAAVVLDPEGRYGFAANTGDGFRVTRFRADGAERPIEARVEGGASGLALDPGARDVSVVHTWTGTVALVDTQYGRPDGKFAIPGPGYRRVAAAPDGKSFWAARRDGMLARVDPRARLAAAAISVSTWDLAVTPDGREVVCACPDAVLRIVTVATGVVARSVELPAEPRGVAVTPDGRFAYVAFPREGRVAAVDLARGVVAGIARAGAGATRLVISRDGRFVFAGGDAGVAVIETNGHAGPPGAVALMKMQLAGEPPAAPTEPPGPP